MLILEDLIEAEKEIFQERAGIREYQGNQSREDAEKGALIDIERRKRNESKKD